MSRHGEISARQPAGAASVSDDAVLVAALAAGDRQALAALYDQHAGSLLAVATRILGDANQAEDLVHDVFLEAWHRAAEYDPSRGSLRAWLIVKTRSRALDGRIRRQRFLKAVARSATDAAVEQSASAHADSAAAMDNARVRGLSAKLPPELVAVLELAYFEGLSCSEIARSIGVPIGTVKSRLARALNCLRAALVPAVRGDA
ncbi:MAG TPA: sigma-70 family RNA polymerase sigma factor [Polyangia bacterium]|nr:sigma-70 family RNA polymerase sigma factor [Polyangia bacterium]